MHIALVIYGSLDQTSGGYLYDRKLVEYLQKRGDTVTILSLPRRSYGASLLQNWKASAFDYSQFDLVIQDELLHPSLFWANPLYQAGPPMLALVHHLRISESHPAFLMPLYRWIERSFLSSVDGFIFNSSATLLSVQRVFPNNRPYVIARPAGNFPKLNRAGTTQGQGGLDILFVGNIIERKGLHTLIQALMALEQTGHSPVRTLMVVGDSSVDPTYARRVERLAKQLPPGRVQCMGKVDDERLLSLYQSSQILAVPSQHEGFGIVYLEAMGLGLVPLASRDGGAVELIDDGVNGFLVSPGDYGGIAEIIARLGTDPVLLQRMAQAAVEKALSFPDWDESMEGIYRFIHDLVGDSGGGKPR
jgi:glycosyltransferase involved in cell wall biosynthesis